MGFTTKDISLSIFNNPSYIKLALKGTKFNSPEAIQLPENTIILVNGEKIIAETRILDGVSVFERISRKPYEVNFEFNMYDRDIPSIPFSPFIFPQGKLELINDMFLENKVINVDNTLLNGYYIEELIIISFHTTTIRGTKTVLGSLKCKENFVNTNQTSLIVQ
jgi:uncharacterized protein YlzI (FlbEa/FlbD family)